MDTGVAAKFSAFCHLRKYLGKGLGPASALLAMFAVIVVLRLHTYNEPLERDLTTYAIIAHEMLDGKPLYTDLWDHKPPAIHVTYAAAELIAGYGRSSIFLMNVAAAAVTLVACYFAGTALTGRIYPGLIAAAIWTIVSGEPGLEANQPNTEVFINALMMSAFAILVRVRKGNLTKPGVLLVGSFFALASLYKQIAVVPAALLCLAHIISAEPAARRKAIADVTMIAGAGALAWALVFGYFTLLGRSDAFIDAVFTYNRSYAGDLLKNFVRGLQELPLETAALVLMTSLGSATLIGLTIGLSRGPRRPWVLLLAFGVGSHVAVLLPGQFFAHYYQLWLPLLVVGTAWTIEVLAQSMPAYRVPIYCTAGVSVVAGLSLLELPHYSAPAELWSLQKYGPVFVESDRVARHLAQLLRRDETFYEWGSETGLYFTSKHDPPSGIFFADPLLSGPFLVELWQRVKADLDRTQPDAIVLERSTVARTPPTHPMTSWVKRNYRAIYRSHMFLVLARRGSPLERRTVKADTKRVLQPAAFKPGL